MSQKFVFGGILCLAVFFLFFSFLFTKTPMNLTYTYVDGTGNQYILHDTALQYLPITVDISSSGVYSGGESKTVTLTPDQVQSITQAFEMAFTTKAEHIENREMLSGLVEKTETGQKKEAILLPSSAQKQALEGLLQNLLTK